MLQKYNRFKKCCKFIKITLNDHQNAGLITLFIGNGGHLVLGSLFGGIHLNIHIILIGEIKMKKLLATAAVCGLVVAGAPAQAEINLDLGGFFKGYGVYSDVDEDSSLAPVSAREFDIIRNTELQLTGETTLDNGLTVGAHFEVNADGNYADAFNVQESYVYFSSGWGRVNFGAEDGAAYLLQVAAPSADSNVDGIRAYVNPVNYAQAQTAASLATAGTILSDSLTNAVLGVNALGTGGIDYDQDATGWADKITYLSPIMNGFQLGLSYTPDVLDASNENALNVNDTAGAFGAAFDAAVRYEGTFDNVGYAVGAGYTSVDEEASAVAAAGVVNDDRTVWNVGLDLDVGAFGLGVVYTEDDFGDIGATATTSRDSEDTLVVGVDYTTGPFKLGASYLDQDGTANLVGATGTDGIETKRWTAGVVYTYGPGMTFRGSISQIDHDNVAGLTNGTSVEATSLLLGTQINF